jgi:hypothetical protein
VTEPYVRQLPEAPDLPHRLGRAGVNHDPRSRQFAFTAPEPRPVVDVAWKRRVGVYDQGNLGSCTAHALCGALSTLPHKHRFRSERNIVKVYSSATAVDPWPGGYYAPDWEDTGSDGLSVAKVALSAGWIREYRHIFAFADFLQAMMVGPIIVGTEWRDRMFYPDPSGQVIPSGSVAGGHEYEVYGLDAVEHRAWCWNSWGPGWGAGGRFWLSWDSLRELLASDGDATVLVP